MCTVIRQCEIISYVLMFVQFLVIVGFFYGTWLMKGKRLEMARLVKELKATNERLNAESREQTERS